MERLSQYVNKTRRNHRKVFVVTSSIQYTADSASITSITSADSQDSQIEMPAIFTADNREILHDKESMSVNEDDYSSQISISASHYATPALSPLSSPWISPSASPSSIAWMPSIGFSENLAQSTSFIDAMESLCSDIGESSNDIPSPFGRILGSSRFSSSDAGVPCPTSDKSLSDEDQLQIISTPPTPILEDISVLRLQRYLQEAGPRTQRATCEFWDTQSDDELRYRNEIFPYIKFVSVDIKLDGKEKLCHWGCLDENGRHMVLSSGEYIFSSVLSDHRMQMRHMSGHRTTNPCLRIPSFIDVSTKAEYEEVRPIREVIRIYFGETREQQSGYGRRTALYASGGAMQYLYQQVP